MTRQDKKDRHANSESGPATAPASKPSAASSGCFLYNGTDPLHADNLPAWCGGVAPPDAVDATIILDFGGNRKKALAELARRFELTKAEEQRKVAALIFRLRRDGATQAEIETAALAEGGRLGLSRAEIIRVAVWVAEQADNAVQIREAA